jgi:hypothetical protein
MHCLMGSGRAVRNSETAQAPTTPIAVPAKPEIHVRLNELLRLTR